MGDKKKKKGKLRICFFITHKCVLVFTFENDTKKREFFLVFLNYVLFNKKNYLVSRHNAKFIKQAHMVE